MCKLVGLLFFFTITNGFQEVNVYFNATYLASDTLQEISEIKYFQITWKNSGVTGDVGQRLKIKACAKIKALKVELLR